jgi:hypothetical protein
MIAAIDRDGALHVIRSTGRVRLHIEIGTYCGKNYDATSAPVLQVPDAVFVQNRADVHHGVKRMPCPQCRITALS